MSFIYGGTSTDTLAGVTATLNEWPSLAGMSLETIDKPTGGRYFAMATRSHSTFVFDVIIEGATTTEVAQRRDQFIELLDPERGPRDLVVEIDTAWKYAEVMVSAGIQWGRMVWERGTGFVLRADVSFETVGAPEAQQMAPEVVPFSSSLSYTLTLGNTASYPTIEFPSGAQATVTIGSFQVVVAATPAGFTNVLNYQDFEFYRKNSSGVKVGNLLAQMSHYGRAQLRKGTAVAVSVTGAPAGTRRLYPNARRI
ncbi:hypothetical protein ACLQ8T_06235 [Glutamicibacter sp. FR1]|uniref:hypothetical protein n=1 Tax=Glutamicibacter sp. FR1 TaxID=3393744 RepID=UPI0039AF2661